MLHEFHWGDIIVRNAIAFVLLLFAARILGKQMIAEMSYFNFVTNITLGSLTGAIILDHHISMGDLVLAITVFTTISLLTSYLTLKNHKTRKLVAGRAIELIRDGKILEKEMEHARIMMESLASQLRLKGVFDVGKVQLALLEPNGQLSVLLKPEFRHLTAGEYMPNPPEAEQIPVELVVDGHVLADNMEKAGLDLAWLMRELEKQGAADTTQVSYAVLTSTGRVYCDKYNDSFDGPPTNSPTTN